VINAITSIVTFPMVFMFLNTQNRQTGALRIILDELIRATQGVLLARSGGVRGRSAEAVSLALRNAGTQGA